MTPRPVAFLLLTAAAAAYIGLALPARRAAADLGDDYRRARVRRRDAALRLSRIERQETARAPRRSGSQFSSEALVALRRSVLESVKASGVSKVRLSFSPGRTPVAASVHLSGEGRFEDVVKLSAGLAPPGSGIVLDRVRFAPGSDTILLELDALSLEGSP